jgi:hypothetical protein
LWLCGPSALTDPVSTSRRLVYPYWFLFGLFAVGALFCVPDFRFEKRLGSLWIGAIVLTLFIGLRYWTGVDWNNYFMTWKAAGFMTLPAFLQNRGGDPAFYTLLWVLRGAGLEYWLLNLTCAAIFTTGLVCFAKRLPNPWLAAFVGVPYLGIVIAMSGTRQATAIGFVFLALLAFFKSRLKAFLAWSAIGALFHASALITVPLAALSYARSFLQQMVLIAATAALAYFALSARIEMYADRYGEASQLLLQSSGTSYRIAMLVLAAIAYVAFVAPSVATEPHERTLWRNYSIASLAAIPLFFVVPSTTSLDRLLLYAYPLQIFALGMLPYALLKVRPALVMLGIIAYFGITMWVFFTFAENAESYIPYQAYGFHL